MADPFSIASGALTVAEVGLKLHVTLKEYIEGVVKADQHFKRITDEVRTTSWALNELGTLLQAEGGDLGILKPAAKEEIKVALDGCRETFRELEDLLNLSKKNGSNSLSIPSKLKFPGRNKKAKSLLIELERLKTTLLLVCHIVPAAKRAAEKDALPLRDRVQLEYLIKAWKDTEGHNESSTVSINARQRSVDSGLSRTMLANPAPGSADQSSHGGANKHQRPLNLKSPLDVDAGSEVPIISHTPALKTLILLPPGEGFGQSSITPRLIDSIAPTLPHPGHPISQESIKLIKTPTPSIPRDNAVLQDLSQPPSTSSRNPSTVYGISPARPSKRVKPSRRQEKVGTQLESCASAVARLSTAIATATKELQENERESDLRKINRPYGTTKRAVEALLAIDQEDFSDDNSEEYVLPIHNHEFDTSRNKIRAHDRSPSWNAKSLHHDESAAAAATVPLTSVAREERHEETIGYSEALEDDMHEEQSQAMTSVSPPFLQRGEKHYLMRQNSPPAETPVRFRSPAFRFRRSTSRHQHVAPRTLTYEACEDLQDTEGDDEDDEDNETDEAQVSEEDGVDPVTALLRKWTTVNV